MRKILIVLVLGLAVASTFAQQNSATSNNNPATILAQPETHKAPGECEFLVFMDNLPWGSSAIQTILTANGESWVLKNSSAMATEDFSLYDVIIIASDQATGFHTNFIANFTKFVTFVTAGGRLQVHSATCGWNSPGCNSVNLPGGVSTLAGEGYLDNYNVIVDPLHPIVAGVSNPFYGNYASHGYFINLVPGTDVITATQSYGNQPTTIQYNYGSGTVTATTCTYEFGYDYGQEAGEMLVNNMNYSCEFVPTPETPVAPWALAIGIFLILAFTALRVYKHS